MATTNYSSGTVISSGWLNDVNRTQYTILGNPSTIADVKTAVLASSNTPIGCTFTKRKTADQSIANSNTLTNDTDLFFSIGANEEWLVTYFVSGTFSGTSGGIQFAATVPSGATLEFSGSSNNGSTASIGGRTTTSGTTLNAWTFGGGPTFHIDTLRLWVLNGANAGTVQLQWAQAASFATPTVLTKGGFLVAYRIA
jgi:hypothetical protein